MLGPGDLGLSKEHAKQCLLCFLPEGLPNMVWPGLHFVQRLCFDNSHLTQPIALLFNSSG
jgi:hypothetical protein